MKPIDKVKQLKEEISKQENRINNCDHDFNEPIFDPEIYKKWVFTHYEGNGSDPIPRGNYIDKEKNRWSRKCKKCGKKEYTYSLEPIKYKPKFN